MSTIKVIFQKLPASELDFQQKLKSVTESKNELHDQFSEIQNLNVRQVSNEYMSLYEVSQPYLF